MADRGLLEFLEASDDDDKDRRKRRRRKPRMWRSARERASWKADLGQAATLARVAYCTMTLVVSASEMLDAIDARKVCRLRVLQALQPMAGSHTCCRRPPLCASFEMKACLTGTRAAGREAESRPRSCGSCTAQTCAPDRPGLRVGRVFHCTAIGRMIVLFVVAGFCTRRHICCLCHVRL